MTNTGHPASSPATCSGATARDLRSPSRAGASERGHLPAGRRSPCRARTPRPADLPVVWIAAMSPAGRFAPSPSADLHIGNVRTAVLAWLFARSTGRRFLMRVEDLDDRTHDDVAQRQLEDLAAIGVTWDVEPQWQSRQRARYDSVIDGLAERGLVYECYCSRRDVLSAPRAPHAPEGAYPGTCRDLTDAERAAKRETGRPPALRLRADASEYTVTDLLLGTYTGVVDDFVLRRGDGVPAYNLAVVVDDALSGIDQVVRGDDLLTSSPRQAYLAGLLGYPQPVYAHVPLVLNTEGKR